jgi:prepilin peptidase CpaA
MGLLLGGFLYGIAFWMGGMGAGDVKLCAAIGAWIGPHQLILALVITGLVGGLMALCWALFSGFVGELLKGTGDLIFGWKRRGTFRDPEMVLANPLKRKMPYAPAIAIGTLMSFFAR